MKRLFCSVFGSWFLVLGLFALFQVLSLILGRIGGRLQILRSYYNYDEHQVASYIPYFTKFIGYIVRKTATLAPFLRPAFAPVVQAM